MKSAYRIIGIRKVGHSVERCEFLRDSFYGDNSASTCKAKMMAEGYVAEIRPTPAVWTQELELS